MKVSDISKLDYRVDKTLIGIEARLAALVDRESQDRARLAELEQIVRDAEGSLVQCRVAQLLSESADEPAEVIHERLASARRETADLHANIEALKLARARLEPTVAAATSEAKVRVAQALLNPYLEAAQSLAALLYQAEAANQLILAIHSKTHSQGLVAAIAASAELQPLGANLFCGQLSSHNGQEHGALMAWRQYVKQILG